MVLQWTCRHKNCTTRHLLTSAPLVKHNIYDDDSDLYLLLLFTFTVCHPWIESTLDWVLMLSNLLEKLIPLFLSFFALFAIRMKVG